MTTTPVAERRAAEARRAEDERARARTADSVAARAEPVRTDMHCTECGRVFVARLDFSVDGNHVVLCPYCSHEHCRVVENGRVTGDRWSTRMQRVDVGRQCVWKADSLPIVTSTASRFLRERWLERVTPTAGRTTSS